MHIQEKPKNASRPQSTGAECCTDTHCESGLRNNYFEHKLLSTESFRVEQKYALERRRLLNRAIHGWGVVNGYAITAGAPDPYGKNTQSGQLKIGPGLALDPCGRELLEVRWRTLSVGDVIVIEKGKRADPPTAFSEVDQAAGRGPAKGPEECWLLCAHYAEQSTSPMDVKDSCQCQHREWDYTCETVRYALHRIACRECCLAADCELQCECGKGSCCGAGDAASLRHPTDVRVQRGGCQCLCDFLTGLEFDGCGPLCEIEEPCGRKVRVDLRHGVPLACIDVVLDKCNAWSFGQELEVCGPRRLVKRNDLLFDLVRGCDLTRIIDISWKDWHRKEEAIPFEEFSKNFGPAGEGEDEYLTAFSVEFSRPVHAETLCPDCFAITVLSPEHEGGWRETLRVPIVRIDTSKFPAQPGDPANHVRGGSIVVEGSWLEDAVRGRKNRFLGAEAWVEIAVRGDFILDCNGQTVDANAAGLYPYPSGNGSPGGTFLSTFRVAAAHDAHYRKGATS